MRHLAGADPKLLRKFSVSGIQNLNDLMANQSREEPKSNDIFVVAMVLVGLLFVGGVVAGIGFVVVNNLGTM